MDRAFKEKLRYLKLDVLSVLHTLSVSDSIALDLENISHSTSTAESDLRGIISTIRRMKTKGKSLIQPAGRDSQGRLRWKINKSAVDKNGLARFLEDEILGKK